MATYWNCYTLLEQLRMQLNEYSSAKVQGTDTSGTYNNTHLLYGLNAAGRFLHAFLMERLPSEFLTEVDLTASSSVFTLPAYFGTLIYFKDDNGRQVFPVGVDNLKLTSATGSDRKYYRKGNTLVLDKAGVSKTYTLYYLKKYRDLNFGQAVSGSGALAIKLATTAVSIADYYNGMTIENITKVWVDTIDDYTAARVATISETAAEDDWYGIVPDFPEWAHHFIIPRAVFEITGNYPVAQEKPNKSASQGFFDSLRIEFLAYGGPAKDIDIEDLFLDFETYGTIGIISNE